MAGTLAANCTVGSRLQRVKLVLGVEDSSIHSLHQLSMEVSGQPHASAALPPVKQPPVPIEEGAMWAQDRSGLFG
jgi:hypothetical protein